MVLLVRILGEIIDSYFCFYYNFQVLKLLIQLLILLCQYHCFFLCKVRLILVLNFRKNLPMLHQLHDEKLSTHFYYVICLLEIIMNFNVPFNLKYLQFHVVIIQNFLNKDKHPLVFKHLNLGLCYLVTNIKHCIWILLMNWNFLRYF